jgi:hypothetical protein
LKLAGLFLLGFALASVVIAWQWQRGERRAADDANRARRASEPPAVFGEPRPKPRDPDAPITKVTEVPADIVRFVERWETSLEAHDLETQASSYAAVVERFYTKSNVRLRDVIAEKRRMLETYPNFHKYDIRNIRVESLTPQRASITFDKDWDASGRRRFAGSEQQRLVLIKVNGNWRIVREEETRVYWVRRS